MASPLDGIFRVMGAPAWVRATDGRPIAAAEAANAASTARRSRFEGGGMSFNRKCRQTRNRQRPLSYRHRRNDPAPSRGLNIHVCCGCHVPRGSRDGPRGNASRTFSNGRRRTGRQGRTWRRRRTTRQRNNRIAGGHYPVGAKAHESLERWIASQAPRRPAPMRRGHRAHHLTSPAKAYRTLRRGRQRLGRSPALRPARRRGPAAVPNRAFQLAVLFSKARKRRWSRSTSI